MSKDTYETKVTQMRQSWSNPKVWVHDDGKSPDQFRAVLEIAGATNRYLGYGP